MMPSPPTDQPLRWSSPHALEICWERLDCSISDMPSRYGGSSSGDATVVGHLKEERFEVCRARWPRGVWCLSGTLEATGSQTKVQARIHLQWSACLFLLAWTAGFVGWVVVGLILWARGEFALERHGALFGVVAVALLSFMPWVIAFLRQIRSAMQSDVSQLEGWLRDVLDLTPDT